jgi:hypothetical protein
MLKQLAEWGKFVEISGFRNVKVEDAKVSWSGAETVALGRGGAVV